MGKHVLDQPLFRDYLNAVGDYNVLHSTQRMGQCAFNVLHIMRPDLSELIRGSTLDPFHRNSPSVDFYEWVRVNW